MDGEIRFTGPSIRVAILSMDAHLLGAARAAERSLRQAIPGLSISFHAAADWEHDDDSRAHVLNAISEADIIIVGMIFLEAQAKPILEALEARAPHCDALLGMVSVPELVKLTRLGKFRMDKPQNGAIELLKKLKGKAKPGRQGEKEMRTLRRLPKILRFIPGTAQDVRAYFLSMQYWLGGSDENVRNLVANLIHRYASGPREALRGRVHVGEPVVYPETGVYHPRMQPTIAEDAGAMPRAKPGSPTIGVLIMRSYALAGDTAHYDAVIEALEERGLNVIPAFASGLDARPAIDRFFRDNDGQPRIDALVSLTGFSLIGGPAYNDAEEAAELLGDLDVPYIAAHALEFQTLPDWAKSRQGLNPVEATMMVAMPELDGATAPTVFGGRASGHGGECTGCDRRCSFPSSGGENRMQPCRERAVNLAARAERMVSLRRKPLADKKAAIVLFNFPPNAGATGTAAFLSVFESLHNLLVEMKSAGYSVDIPETVDELRRTLTEGNAQLFGAEANVHHRMPVADYIRRETRLADLEDQWGAAPGRVQTDGASIHVLGAQFGNVFVGLQPAFGYEGDPMRLLFEADFVPTHAFCAFYRYIREDFGADAVLHFGTHGALEFMPGKQTGMTGDCWPSYLIGDLPNFYFYAANNPSEAAIAKRRSAATTVSYLTSSVTQAGLYRSLADLKSTADRWRKTDPADLTQRRSLALLTQAQAAALELAEAEPQWDADTDDRMTDLLATLHEYEAELIPDGLHVAGSIPSVETRKDALLAMAGPDSPAPVPETAIDEILEGQTAEQIAERHDLSSSLSQLRELVRVDRCLQQDGEISALLRALDGRFISPAPGGDLVSNSSIVPTGRNIHGFDSFRMPSAFAVRDGKEQAQRLLDRHLKDEGALPETVAIVLWGTDNLKTEGAQIAQALALMGAEPRFDSYGRLAGAQLVALSDLGRPRIDVFTTLSGIFRDLLPMQTRLLAEAALLAAQADEPLEQNIIRKHALAYQEEHGCDLATAALRVFSNGDGAYGANVNRLVDAGCWTDEADLAEAYTNRKCFAYGTDGTPRKSADLLGSILADVDLAYQNLESIEVGITTIDHYFDTLGGIGRAVREAKGTQAPVYIGDQTRGRGTVRTLSEQVSLETRTRTLNPKWFEGMLKHGYEGVRQIEAQVTHTLGWSATTGKVAPWVYQEIADTFVLDKNLRERIASLNPRSAARVADRLLEASQRQYWTPSPETLDALQATCDDLEDRIEGIHPAEGATA